ncbi:hypothetical protein PIB30_092772 [Stylosanthes scabra]|uniref:Uncharacterized protein n=1 Tax=Stylosanthes scabra TaxID=79078 RepID=A0ABU6UWP8_9FABA|nr:hypothetical protein [Stylosanthes scabra]
MGGYYAGHYDRHNVVGSAGIPQEGSGSGGSLNATSQVDNSTSLFSYPMVTQGASGSGASLFPTSREREKVRESEGGSIERKRKRKVAKA